MRIVSLQYVHVTCPDPNDWLDRISFYTGIFDALSIDFEVQSYYHLNYEGVHKKNNVTYHFTKLKGFQLAFPFRLHRQIKRLNPDVILIQGFQHPFQVWLLRKALKKGVKFFIHHHAERPLRFHKLLFHRLIDRTVSGYFFVSFKQAQEWILARQIRDPKKIYEVMECSSIYKIIDRPMAMKQTGATGKAYLWVGRLDENKDPVTLIKAFKEFSAIHSQVSLYVIYQQESLIAQVKRLLKGCDRIFLVGKQNKEQLLNWYNSAEFIISTSHYEGSGIAVCEAMSCGCIPILSSLHSFNWMAKGVGLAFNAGDAKSLQEALETTLALDVESERSKVIENFRKRLSFEAIAKTMHQAFTK